MHSMDNSHSQWIFPMSALVATPAMALSGYSIQRELNERAKGIEFLFRLGSSLGLPSSAMFTAATWFHRFYMRCSLEDFDFQDVGASCIFLATKTEECGRKLRDVARVCRAKKTGEDVTNIQPDSKEVEEIQAAILLNEEVLLEVICFDFVVSSPHADLVELFDAHDCDPLVLEYAWSIAHDSYRTPLCILYGPRIIATACYIYAQRVNDGPLSPSLDARVSLSAPSASLPTPPSHKPASPDASRFVIQYFGLGEVELVSVAATLSILVEFYNAQSSQNNASHLNPLIAIPPPTVCPARPQLFSSCHTALTDPNMTPNGLHSHTPPSTHGGNTPTLPVVKDIPRGPETKPTFRLDLS